MIPVHQHPHMPYRPDIDGLRAIAVLAVVWFHAFPSYLKGDFIGVDIFFVISGFLISGIVFRGLENGHFSFQDFYSRRVRRIFPALLLVLVTSFIFGWYVLFAIEYRQLGKHIAGGIAFISNLLYWNESGYFDNIATTKPLLHLWSLAIEEQFYIFWPLLVWVAWRKQINLLTLSLFIACISFCLNLYIIHTDMVVAFYAPLTRFWELLAGSALAYISLYRQNLWANYLQKLDEWLGQAIYMQAPQANGNILRHVLSFVGLGLIMIGIYIITEQHAFPGGWALLPVCGALLIIAAGPHAWLNCTLLSHPVLIWIGLISFPLYLWHWPILSFMHILHGKMPGVAARLGAVIISILLAWVTYRLIEKPIRFGKYLKAKTLLLYVLMLITGGTGYYTYMQEGLPERAIAKQENILFSHNNENEKEIMRCFIPHVIADGSAKNIFIQNQCDKGTAPGRPKAFLVGDSHSLNLGIGLKEVLAEKQYDIYQFSAAACGPFAFEDQRSERKMHCPSINHYVWQEILQKRPELLIISARYTERANDFAIASYPQFLLEKTQELKAAGVKKIMIVGMIPSWKSDLPKLLVRQFLTKRKTIPKRTYKDIDQSTLDWDTKLRYLPYPDGVTYISLKDFLCNAEGCITYVGEHLQANLIVFDREGHLTKPGAHYISRELLEKYIP